MTIFFEILFIFSAFIIFYSYVIFPVLILLFSKKIKPQHFNPEDNLPTVSILISVYNEEVIIKEKIDSILESDYPLDKIEILIGSDNSDDNSNNIISDYAKKYSFINFFPFYERQGKQNIINKIQTSAKGEILILTDANVIFTKNTIFELVKYFKDTGIGLVDSRIINRGIVKNGISIQESTYLSREVRIKSNESCLWGTMMGPSGGCFAIRNKFYKPVPSNFLVDDFYINMKILEQGYKTINNTEAIVYEDVSNNLNDEFKRKVRISTGNFQNLAAFKHLIFYGLGFKSKKVSDKIYYNAFGLSLSFLSHKVLRWLIPFFLVFIIISGIFLFNIKLYFISYLIFLSSLLFPFIDTLVLRKLKTHIPILRFITHFYSMNIALLIGFVKYVKGVKSGVWKPTKRNQSNNT